MNLDTTLTLAASAEQHALDVGDPVVDVEHVLLAVSSAGGAASQYLATHGITGNRLHQAIHAVRDADAAQAGITLPTPDGSGSARPHHRLPYAECAQTLLSALRGGTVGDIVTCAQEPSGFNAAVLTELDLDVSALADEATPADALRDAECASHPAESTPTSIRFAATTSATRFVAQEPQTLRASLHDVSVVERVMHPESTAAQMTSRIDGHALEHRLDHRQGTMVMRTTISANNHEVQWVSRVADADGRFARNKGMTHRAATFTVTTAAGGSTVRLHLAVRAFGRLPWLVRPLIQMSIGHQARAMLQHIEATLTR